MNVGSLAYVPGSNTLVGAQKIGQRNLLSVDPDTGIATSVAQMAVEVSAMTYDVGNLSFIVGAEDGLDSFLYRMDSVGTLAQIGTASGLGLNVGVQHFFVRGLAYMRLPDPTSQLSAPTGLALTESGGDITAAWDAVTDATGYVLEWREEGSGDSWQDCRRCRATAHLYAVGSDHG